ncbi:zinc-binding alcohol dehydrogenase family protein [Cohnella pontilimi]|uniref:Zinc-binding alcohol dehydrogenase family protein n=1 Tax=Cohnella pontilimi TaxID=2564100 RepID=A0A4U0F5E8_9BACL|nr:zinc-binding alcohol dehydrogenase family protein [Cohnella pontilimi]TJY39847.1 zinc-binding alcohol dehydrogenase family protein [Cohnella pontilimi]
MKRISLNEPNQLAMREVEEPTLKDGEALVRVRRIGICGTDYHAFRGRQPFFEYPRVLGHELAGEVVKVQANGSAFSAGDKVTIVPYLECGQCIACLSGKPNCCSQLQVLGVHADGGMQEYFAVPVSHLMKTSEISLDAAATVECLSIGAHAVRRADIKKGEFALVIGAGPIGLGVMQFAQLAGAKVIAMDMNQGRLDFCKTWAKVDYTVNASENPAEEMRRITNGQFPTVVFDATGNAKSMSGAYQYAAHGGRIVYVGLVQADLSFPDPEFHKRELTILSSRNATVEDFENVIEMIRQGHVDTDAFITSRTPFDQIIDKFEYFMTPESGTIKAMITL